MVNIDTPIKIDIHTRALKTYGIKHILDNEELEFLPCLKRISKKLMRPYHKRHVLLGKFRYEFEIFLKAHNNEQHGNTNAEPLIQRTPNYMTSLPMQTSFGKIIVLEVIERVINIGFCELNGNLHCKLDQENFQIPLNIRIGNSNELFNFIAEIFEKFVISRKIDVEKVKFGWTFGYSIRQTSGNDGHFTSWNGSLQVSGMTTMSLKEHLRGALKARGFNIEPVVLTSLPVAYISAIMTMFRNSKIGVNFDSQISMVYAEESSKHKKFVHLNADQIGDLELKDCLTKADRDNDDKEKLALKMTSLKGMADIFRRCLIILIKAKEVLNGKIPDKLESPSSVTICPLTENIDNLRSENCIIFEETFIITIKCQFTKEDIRKVQHLARLIIRRAAHILGIILASLVSTIFHGHDLIVGIGGSVVKNNPAFVVMIEYMIEDLLPDRNIVLYDCNALSLRGIAAAVSASSNKYLPKLKFETPYVFLPKSLKIFKQIRQGIGRNIFKVSSISRSVSLYDNDARSLLLSDMKLDYSNNQDIENDHTITMNKSSLSENDPVYDEEGRLKVKKSSDIFESAEEKASSDYYVYDDPKSKANEGKTMDNRLEIPDNNKMRLSTEVFNSVSSGNYQQNDLDQLKSISADASANFDGQTSNEKKLLKDQKDEFETTDVKTISATSKEEVDPKSKTLSAKSELKNRSFSYSLKNPDSLGNKHRKHEANRPRLSENVETTRSRTLSASHQQRNSLKNNVKTYEPMSRGSYNKPEKNFSEGQTKTYQPNDIDLKETDFNESTAGKLKTRNFSFENEDDLKVRSRNSQDKLTKSDNKNYPKQSNEETLPPKISTENYESALEGERKNTEDTEYFDNDGQSTISINIREIN